MFSLAACKVPSAAGAGFAGGTPCKPPAAHAPAPDPTGQRPAAEVPAVGRAVEVQQPASGGSGGAVTGPGALSRGWLGGHNCCMVVCKAPGCCWGVTGR
jgi:hypothetical protein